MKFVIFEVLSEKWSLLLLSFVYYLAYPGGPLVKFHAPIRNSGQGDYDQEGALVSLGLDQMAE